MAAAERPCWKCDYAPQRGGFRFSERNVVPYSKQNGKEKYTLWRIIVDGIETLLFRILLSMLDGFWRTAWSKSLTAAICSSLGVHFCSSLLFLSVHQKPLKIQTAAAFFHFNFYFLFPFCNISFQRLSVSRGFCVRIMHCLCRSFTRNTFLSLLRGFSACFLFVQRGKEFRFSFCFMRKS